VRGKGQCPPKHVKGGGAELSHFSNLELLVQNITKKVCCSEVMKGVQASHRVRPSIRFLAPLPPRFISVDALVMSTKDISVHSYSSFPKSDRNVFSYVCPLNNSLHYAMPQIYFTYKTSRNLTMTTYWGFIINVT